MSPAAARAASIDDLLCFDLYAASRAITACYRPVLSELGLTYPQYLVVRLLSEGPPRPVSDLASDLHLDHGTMTPLLRRLESAGLITRTRSARDERVVEIELTAQGRALQARFTAIDCHLRDAMGLEETEARNLQIQLRSLTEHLTC
ncbi:MarR family winged helix-turn-helix transcriptional regulator [Aeromicrobium sp. CF3.5]|uniref:MarR family winged helix-turn-helix transcriptional regulator n=1 Tax=Aeromicrobium sp. CF3.5 TaxID=3373078 RepID=UPI003EE5B87F